MPGGKQLLLWRHAKSSWGDPSLEDNDRPLNTRGRKAAQAMAPVIASHQPQYILCSPAARTLETMAALQDHLPADTLVDIEPRLYESSVTQYLKCLRQVDDRHERVLVIGHNPVLADLINLIAHSADAQAQQRLSEKLPTGTFALLTDLPNRWRELDRDMGILAKAVRPADLADGPRQ